MVQVFKNIIDINFIVIDALFTFELPFNTYEAGIRSENITIGILLCGVIVLFSTIKLLIDIMGIKEED